MECLAPEADWTSNEGVYDAYVDWCAEKGEIPDKREYFGKDFGEVLRKVKRRRRTVNNSRLWGYAGVGIRPAPAG